MNSTSDIDNGRQGLRGMDLLNKPVLNKSTAFTYEERTALGLHGLLPPQVETIQEQVTRAYEAYQHKTDDLERHIYLRQLQDANEVLFYRLLLEHVEEMTPVIYTPVVAQACQQFSHIYRRPRGLFVSYPLRDSMRILLNNRPHRDVDVIVVTDGQRVLGIGDQGAGGLGISIGKLSLYTLIGGIHPTRTLPIVLDVGANNQQLLNDPLYIGWRHERLEGQPYYDFVDQFVEAIRQEMPNTCLQWEDFATPHARTILDRYRDRVLSFNDDIQGTAAVTLAALISAVRVTGKSLKDQRIVFLGAGSASIGVAEFLLGAMVEDGLTAPEARSRMWIVDIHGVLHSGRTDLTPEQAVCAQPLDSMANWFLQLASHDRLIGIQVDDKSQTSERRFHLEDVVRNVKPTILIGLSTAGGSFTEPIVREMASHVERPIIFPLSNPTANSEAVPADLVRWTEGRALIATGSPFPTVMYQGRIIPVSQCNNVYIFPAIGLGVRASRAARISDRMVLSAVLKLAEHSPTLKDATASIFPALKDLRPVAAEMAVAIGMEAIRSGLAPEATEQQLYTDIQLLGQNVNAYADPIKKKSFAELLYAVGCIPGIRRVRFTTSHPRHFGKDIVDAMETLPTICDHIHLPVQSGSSTVLKAMNREYTREMYLERISWIRSAKREIALTTDVIVGFPGETNGDFEETITLLYECQFDGVFSFKYSPRPNTPALNMADSIPDEVKSQRLQILQERQREIQRANYERKVGKIFEVMVEGMNEARGQVVGRTSQNITLNFTTSSVVPEAGTYANVLVTKSFPNSLVGQMVD